MSSVRHCPNPECPSRVKYQRAAEYRAEATHCHDCGGVLADGPAPAVRSEPVAAAVAVPEPRGAVDAADLWRRGAVSLAALVAAAFSTRVLLPGVDSAMLADMERVATGGQVPWMPSVFGLGLNPFLSAFVMVELAALLVPAWRPLRTSGPEGRARLRNAVGVLGVVLALVQSLGIAKFFESMQAGEYPLFLPSQLLPVPVVMGLLTGGVLALHLLTVLVDRQGLGHGYAVVLLGLWAPSAYHLASTFLQLVQQEVVAVVPAALVMLGGVGLVRWLVRRLRGQAMGPGSGQPVSFPLPTSGLAPVQVTFALLALPVTLSNAGWIPGDLARALHSDAWVHLFLALVLSALLTVGLSALFHTPWRVGATWAALTAKDEDSRARVLEGATRRARELLPQAIQASLLLVMLSWLPSQLSTRWLGVRLPEASLLFLGVAIVVDMLDEVRLRQAGTWVSVWPVHRVYEVEPALAALSAAGIPARARGTHTRAMTQFFGPYFPIDLMVPPERAEEARRLLRVAGRP